MTSRDPAHELAAWRRRYAEAVAARDRAEPGSDAYRRAVQEVGHVWTQIKRAERALWEDIERAAGSGPARLDREDPRTGR